MDTKGGNLLVKNSSGLIQAVTYAGEIELYGITGGIDVKTMSGNILAEINPSTEQRAVCFLKMEILTFICRASRKPKLKRKLKHGAIGNIETMISKLNRILIRRNRL
jgi:hypothetical protein